MTEKHVSLSDGWSGRNRHKIFCEMVSSYRHYGVCAHLIGAYDAGRLVPEDVQGDCANAMKHGNCKAVAMRNEEIEAGHAIYYKSPRIRENPLDDDTKPVDTNSESYKRGWNAVSGGQKKRPVKPRGEASLKHDRVTVDAGDYAAAINTAMHATNTATADDDGKAEQATLVRKPGETMLEFARRLKRSTAA